MAKRSGGLSEVGHNKRNRLHSGSLSHWNNGSVLRHGEGKPSGFCRRAGICDCCLPYASEETEKIPQREISFRIGPARQAVHLTRIRHFGIHPKT